MKKISLVCVIICMFAAFSSCNSASRSSEGVVFETGTFEQILIKAKQENKLIFMDAYASWCTPCKRMTSDVFTNKKVGDYLNANFINAKFDMEKGDGLKIAERYNVNRFPTFLILDGDAVVKGTLIGGSPADEFLIRIKTLADSIKME